MRKIILTLAAPCALAAFVPAQTTWETLPAGFDALPGNARLSMPGRWSWGTLQVIYQDSLFANLQGQSITRLRLRKPAMFDEPAYAARTATFEVSLGPSPRAPQNMSGSRFDQNDTRPQPVGPSIPVVFAQRSYAMPATPPPGQADVVGAEIVDLPLDQPVPVPAGSDVLLEWRCVDVAFQVFADGWVDAVWLQGGADLGLGLPVGQRGCGGQGAAPMRLDVGSGGGHPRFGQNATVELDGAPAGAPTAVVLGIDPLSMSSPTGFGQAIPVPPFVPGCQLWTPLSFVIDAGTTSPGGTLSHTFDFPPTNDPILVGAQLGVQALVVDQLQISASNGVVLWMDSIEVGSNVATGLWPRDDETAWPPWIGLTPVVGFGY